MLPSLQLLLPPAVVRRCPVKLIALGQHQALQVPVLSPLLQPLLLQYRDQHVPALHRPHDLGQDLLLLLQLGGALLCVWSDAGERGEREEELYLLLHLIILLLSGT